MSHSDFAHPYFGVFFLFVFSIVAFVLVGLLSRIVGNSFARKSEEKLKLAPYECGPLPNKQSNRISARFFVVALLFILFDIEILFMFPWALDVKILGIFGLLGMLFFIAVLAIGFIYEWKKGALEWQQIQ